MILRESNFYNFLNDLQMKKTVKNVLILMLFGVFAFNTASAQFDDLYYDPETDESFIFTSSDYDGNDYNDQAYGDDYSDTEYDSDYDDYDYQYSSRIRRFRRSNFNYGYYHPYYAERMYYDGYSAFPRTSIYIGFGNPYYGFWSYHQRRSYRNWLRYRYYNPYAYYGYGYGHYGDTYYNNYYTNNYWSNNYYYDNYYYDNWNYGCPNNGWGWSNNSNGNANSNSNSNNGTDTYWGGRNGSSTSSSTSGPTRKPNLRTPKHLHAVSVSNPGDREPNREGNIKTNRPPNTRKRVKGHSIGIGNDKGTSGRFNQRPPKRPTRKRAKALRNNERDVRMGTTRPNTTTRPTRKHRRHDVKTSRRPKRDIEVRNPNRSNPYTSPSRSNRRPQSVYNGSSRRPNRSSGSMRSGSSRSSNSGSMHRSSRSSSRSGSMRSGSSSRSSSSGSVRSSRSSSSSSSSGSSRRSNSRSGGRG